MTWIDNMFEVNDKVICIDASPDFAAFGPLPNNLEVGKVYVIHEIVKTNLRRGECLRIDSNTLHSYEQRHFRPYTRH